MSSPGNGRDPGEVARFNFAFSVKVGWISSVIAGLAIFFFIFLPSQRDFIRFAVSTIAMAGGITSAFYVGENIRQNLQAREISERSKKIERAWDYIDAWTSPQLSQVRKSGREIRELIASSPANQHSQIIKDALSKNHDLEQDIVTVLNFLESMALARKKGLCDDQTLYDYFKVIVYRYCHFLQLWMIEERRGRSSELYQEILDLYEAWHPPRQ